MKSRLDVDQRVQACLERLRGIESSLKWSNPFRVLHLRKGKIINIYEGFNDVTIEGKNHILDVTFGKATPVSQVDPWYIGLIDNTPTPVLSENDTLASHSGWNEFTSYSGNRKAWDDADAASKVKGTNTTSDFTMSASGTIYGIMVASVASGTTGILWATGAFDSTINVVSSDVLKVTYGLRL